MLFSLVLLLGCPSPDDATPDDTPSDDSASEGSGHTAADTGTTGTTGSTGSPMHTGATGDTGSGTTDTGPLACATSPSAPARTRTDADPTPFSPRTDGLHWFAESGFVRMGVYEGVDPGTATLAYDIVAERIYEDPYGVVHVLGDGSLHRIEPPGAPVLVATGLSPESSAPSDIAVHPAGTVAFTSYAFGRGGVDEIVVVLADGTVHRQEATPLGLLRPSAVEWNRDRTQLWVLDDSRLYLADVDAVGLPDWSTLAVVPTPPFATVFFSDLAVDACDGLWLYWTLGFGVGGLAHLDPATGVTTTWPAVVDQGYGFAPLRFGRAPGEERQLRTVSGGWGSIDVDWLVWDVGVEEAPWP